MWARFSDADGLPCYEAMLQRRYHHTTTPPLFCCCCCCWIKYGYTRIWHTEVSEWVCCCCCLILVCIHNCLPSHFCSTDHIDRVLNICYDQWKQSAHTFCLYEHRAAWLIPVCRQEYLKTRRHSVHFSQADFVKDSMRQIHGTVKTVGTIQGK